MASGLYNRGFPEWGAWTTSTYRALIVTSSYTFNADHDYVANLTNEITASGYARATIAGKTVTIDDTNDRAVFGSSDPSFGTPASQSPAGVVLYRLVTSDADSILMAYIDVTGSAVTFNGSTATYTVPALGWNYMSA